ncbi:MAG: hypothetical protein JWL85_15, partial [Candidatus Saccharibacteria bacterium]|nr:hypothetical protein [Candidatus Saccharibacteria bacterium]
QNFATDSFSVILSEARKYALNLTVANQYIAQMPLTVKDAVFGNVGSIISFRMSADDARVMQRYFEPKFEEYDLVHMHNRHFVVSMTIEGEKIQAFSATTLNLPTQGTDYSDAIIARSRAEYAVGRDKIEYFMHERYLTPARQTRQTVAPKRAIAEAPAAKSTEKPAAQNISAATISEAKPAPKIEQAPVKKEGIVNNLVGTVAKVTKVEEVPEATDRPKRKRKRTRKKKQDATTQTMAVAKPAPKAVSMPVKKDRDIDETVIRLR